MNVLNYVFGIETVYRGKFSNHSKGNHIHKNVVDFNFHEKKINNEIAKKNNVKNLENDFSKIFFISFLNSLSSFNCINFISND